MCDVTGTSPPSHAADELPKHLKSLTGLRFYAASAVLLRHTVVPFLPLPVLKQLAIPGPIGVGFFFVLSGFVLTWAWRAESTKRRFWFDRFARIYPLHLGLTVAAVGVLLANDTPRWASTVLSLFLLQSWLTDYYRTGGNGVSWSLSCEAFFYACFPFFIGKMRNWSLRRGLVFVPVVMGLMAAYTIAYALITQHGYWWASAVSTYTNPVYRIGEFVIGICLALAIRRGFRLRLMPSVALAGGAVGYVALSGLNWAVARSGIGIGGESGLPLGVLDLLYLPITVLLIAVMASADIDRKPTPVSGQRHVKLGQWSFALYLVQVIVIDIVADWIGPDPSAGVGALCVLGSTVVCIGLSAALHERVEAPINQRLRRWMDRRTDSPVHAGLA